MKVCTIKAQNGLCLSQRYTPLPTRRQCLFTWYYRFFICVDVTYDHRTLVIDGNRRVVVSGSIDYLRSTPDDVSHVMGKIKNYLQWLKKMVKLQKVIITVGLDFLLFSFKSMDLSITLLRL